jgi:diadenylate cyclase
VAEFLDQILFVLQRITWLSVLDIVLVALVFFVIFIMVSDTQAMVLLRGMILVIILLSFFTSILELSAFSWLVRTTLPALLLSIPVIFAPEIRRGLERLGRAGSNSGNFTHSPSEQQALQNTIKAVVTAAARLSAKQHGALIILQRRDNLREYNQTGTILNSTVTPELLLQIFFPNTPLHDGAVIIAHNRVVAAACVMPLSASGVLKSTAERKMGLRHRAALGISEASDAIAVVVSEETGAISIAQNGRMIRRLDSERSENVLMAFYRPSETSSAPVRFLRRLFKRDETQDRQKED